MRLTDDRYAGEQAQFTLALRMLGHEARTKTIRDCTGLSSERIRKLYGTYFTNSAVKGRRLRGKSPQQIQRFVKNPDYQLQATTLVALFCIGLMLRVDSRGHIHSRWRRPDVEFGHRMCRAFETYLLVHDQALLSFEWAWNLLQSVMTSDDLIFALCNFCHSRYVHDAGGLNFRICPACNIATRRRRENL